MRKPRREVRCRQCRHGFQGLDREVFQRGSRGRFMRASRFTGLEFRGSYTRLGFSEGVGIPPVCLHLIVGHRHLS